MSATFFSRVDSTTGGAAAATRGRHRFVSNRGDAGSASIPTIPLFFWSIDWSIDWSRPAGSVLKVVSILRQYCILQVMIFKCETLKSHHTRGQWWTRKVSPVFNIPRSHWLCSYGQFSEAEGQIAFFQHNISGQLVHFSAKMKRVRALLVLISSEFIVQVTSSLVAGNLSCRYPEESVS